MSAFVRVYLILLFCFTGS